MADTKATTIRMDRGFRLFDDDMAEKTDIATRTERLKVALKTYNQLADAYAEAVEHPDMTPELAELLSVDNLQIEVRRETNINIAPDESPTP